MIEVLLCPSHPRLENPVDWTNTSQHWPNLAWADGFYAASHYGGNGGTLPFNFFSAPSEDGVFFQSSRVRLADITDGTSNTFLFGERSHEDPEYDRLTAAFDPGMAHWSNLAPGAGRATGPVRAQPIRSALPCLSITVYRLSPMPAIGSG